MPQRYEREIEEILKSLDHPEDSPRRAQTAPVLKIRFRKRRRFHIHFFQLSLLEWVLFVSITLTLLSGEVAFLYAPTAWTAAGALTALALLFLAPFAHRFSSTRKRSSRNIYYQQKSTKLGITPLFRRIAAPITLWWLKWKYRARR